MSTKPLQIARKLRTSDDKALCSIHDDKLHSH